MKKLIITSVTILFIGLTAYANDADNCSKKCGKKCDPKECMKSDTKNNKCCMIENKTEMKCSKEKQNCNQKEGSNQEKKDKKSDKN